MVREQRLTLTHGSTRLLEAGNGWPVVLLHGFPLNADMWRPQLERVPDGWRFIAPDLPGFGPGAAGGATTMEEMAAGVAAVLDALEVDKATIGGLSMGGYVTFALLRRAPERFSAVLLADTRSAADTDQGRAAREKMREILRTGGVSAVADEMMPKLLGETTRRESPDVEQRVRAMIDVNSAAALDGALAAMRDRPDSTPLLSAISVPALLMVGEEDVLTPPADSQAMRAQMRRARLVTLQRAGHLSNLEVSDDFSSALADFLVAPL